MRYQSTRGEAAPHTFLEAVAAGLAPDGGLFLPVQLPSIHPHLGAWAALSYAELAAEFFQLFAPEISKSEWHALTREAYGNFSHPEVAPLVALGDHTSVLELFHGPTLAFKDFALQLLGLLYKRQTQLSGKHLAVLGATSGDTGSAAIHGCLGREGITIFILYPDGRVAPLQERQMACTGAANVFAIPIPGTFDDAQRIVKEIFGDTEFASAINLSAVNSINIARVLAQSVYYIWAWLRLTPAQQANVEFVVPTGNFGNVMAGWLAKRMGLPITRFCVATNQNDILYRFFTTGHYGEGTVQPSHAPSMDIQAASNFERYLYYLMDGDTTRLRAAMKQMKATGALDLSPLPAADFVATRMDDVEIAAVIAQVAREHDYVVDPHTACGFAKTSDPAAHRVILATASPAKFPEIVAQATGAEPTDPSLERLKSRPLQRWPLPAEASSVRAFLTAHCPA
jgi:threonine synthase